MVHRPASSNTGVKASVDRLEMTGQSSVVGKEDAPVIITTEKEEAGMCVCACIVLVCALCVCVCVCARACMPVYMYVCMYTCVCVCV